MNRTVAAASLADSTPGSTAIVTYMGHTIDVFDPSTWVFDLDDIATSLANTCRFGGHTDFYSVAEHSMRVASFLKGNGESAEVQMIGLLHDGVETYIGDIPRPIKSQCWLGDEHIHFLEKSMEYAMFGAFDLLIPNFDTLWKVVKGADLAVYRWEAAERPQVGRGLLPDAARTEFLQHYEFLRQMIG